MKVAWNRLIRFVATDGRVLNGEPILPSEDFDLGQVTEKDKLTAKVIKGEDIYGDAQVSDEVVTVKKLLGPLAAADVPILRCVGLNYAKHSKSLLRVTLAVSWRCIPAQVLLPAESGFSLFVPGSSIFTPL
jgi:hypothetical protein